MKPLSENEKDKLDRLIVILDEFVERGNLIEDILDDVIGDDDVKVGIYVRISLFTRFVHRIESITLLLKQFESKPIVNDSIGLLIRAGLADVLPMWYLEDIHSKVVKCPS